MSEVHHLKSWPELFRLHTSGELEFSIRNDDRNYQIGDICKFHEYKNGEYTGKISPWYRVRYIQKRVPGLMPGYVVLLLDGPWYKC